MYLGCVSVRVKLMCSLLGSTEHTRANLLNFRTDQRQNEIRNLPRYLLQYLHLTSLQIFIGGGEESLHDSIHIALGHRGCNCLTFMNKGIVLILCKVVVCAAVNIHSIFWEKVLSIFKIISDSYSLPLFPKFSYLKFYMKPCEMSSDGQK